MKNSIDKKFDDGDHVLSDFDTDHAVRPNEELKRVNVDFPSWMVAQLDSQSRYLGISRQALIKTIIAQKLESK